ncbi:NAD-dependent epimerase [Ideonella sp. A 288]|uniref:NAD-dependent epimerase n=1 Tax=Ideonella sp. A 288 TaxID=1962181 RepID=UPI000B4B6B1A|nr:NAD-dependent epimerase [Ideonella sp. A 288]
MLVLVTGAAGFIGMHVAQALLARGDQVLGIDNLNDYYDVGLKRARLAQLARHPGFSFAAVDVADTAAVASLFAQGGIDRVVHLAAQAGVRYSVTHPHAYAQANLVGFLNILEGCRAQAIGHLVYASSSSVYGGNTKMPFAEDDPVDHPVSLYAATKKANELMAHSYSHLYAIPCTGLRFFTVYGPWGRPDMAYFSFTKAILAGEPIAVFNHGQMRRDFTYIDDIVAGVVGVLDRPPARGAEGAAACRVLNIGSHAPVPLLDFIGELERALGRKATLRLEPMQPGDVPATYADVSRLQELTGITGPATPLRTGIERFVRWYAEHHGLSLTPAD